MLTALFQSPSITVFIPPVTSMIVNGHQARVEYLGQSGVRIDTFDTTILIDPYLSHSVELLDSPDLVRQVPIPYDPSSLSSVDWVLITHDHMDHLIRILFHLLLRRVPAILLDRYQYAIN